MESSWKSPMRVFSQTLLLAVIAILGLAPVAHADTDTSRDQATILDVALRDGGFTTLATALKAAGLDDKLKSDGPFTVFAPTDAAFAKLPAGTIENLLKPRNRNQLEAILTYHIVPGIVTADEVAELGEARTMHGARIHIRADADGMHVDDARVIAKDKAAANGVIHTIDTVILPR
jgi:uncharacterized surface protein with fasciclin (FAS1) repeats